MLLWARQADRVQIFSNVFLSRSLEEGAVKMEREGCIKEFSADHCVPQDLREKPSCDS